MCSWVVRKVVKIKDQCEVVSRDLSASDAVCAYKACFSFWTKSRDPEKCCSKFDRYGICMKYQRRWYKICARGLCGKLCKIGVNTVDLLVVGPCLWCCFLVLEMFFAFQCVFFVEKGFQPFLHCFPVHCSENYCLFITPLKFEILLTNLASNRRCGWRNCG